MKILVTGSAGFIGSALTINLLNRGDEVIGIDNHNDYYDPKLKEMRLSRHINHSNYNHIRMNIEDNSAVVKLFNPAGVGTWWLSELNPDENIAYGYALLNDPLFAELGYVDIAELQNLKLPLGLGIERDRYFNPMPIDKVIEQVQESR